MIIAFIVFTVLALASAFLAVDENVYGIKPAATEFSDGWQVDSQDIVLPYRSDDVIVATKVLPRVTFDDHLIVKARYDELKVYVDDELIYRTTPT
ncbi:MAG: hypothetical protein Q4A08_04150, partial [Bacteroidales bacterium]|nr:hypothetical protein [Bacteroidales bacterium]